MTPCAAASTDWAALSAPIFRSVGDVAGTSVTAIAEDGAGFLWFGGQSGLSRWDGYRFRSYRPDAQTAGAIPDANINALHTDRRGRLWIGTSTGGVARYDPAHDDFVSYGAGRDGLSNDSVSALADDGAGGLWIGTSGGLDHRLEPSGKFEHYRHDATPGSLPDNSIRQLLLDRHGSLWVVTDTNLARRDPVTGRFVAVALPAADGQHALPTALAQDSAGRIWIGTDHDGIYLVERDRGTAHAVRLVSHADNALLAIGNIETICEARPGELWIGTSEHGIAVFDTSTRRVRWLRNDPTISTSLPQNLVFALYRDRSGLVWVGMLSGLRYVDTQQTAITSVVTESSRSGGLADSDVTALLSASDNRAWVGFSGHGIDIVDPVHGRVGALRPGRRPSEGTLPELTVRALAGYPQGPIFIGTGHGLYETDRNAHGLRRIVMAGTASDHIDSLRVIDGVLWIGTSAKGVWRLDPGATTARHLERTGLTNNRITVIAPASPGHLWIGTYGGLNLLDTQSGRAQHITDELPKPAHIEGAFIASLLTDACGRLWVGTFGRGIQILDRLDRSGHGDFIQLSDHEGLPNTNIDSLVADNQGRIWAATDDGVAAVDSTSFEVRALHRADGIEFSNYYLGASARLDNGDILFGSTGGLTIIRPALVHDWSYTPPVVVTDLRVGGQPVPAFDANSAATLVISPQANSLAVEFAALDYSAPEQNQYAYRLDGYDRNWITTDASRRLAAYTNLPPGSYTLALRGSNRSGRFGKTLTVAVRVDPAWNQTASFRILEAALALALLAGFVHVRTAYLRRRERELQQQVEARTAELRAIAIELRQREVDLQQIAYHDALTNLPNRRKFTEEFTRLLARDDLHQHTSALLLVDLDHFKLVNDTIGHDAGDALLVEVAHRLQSSVRSTDCVARLGGDEFAILLDGEHNVAELDRICERIIASLTEPIAFGHLELRASASIGIAIAPQHGLTKDALYKSADTALYAAKRDGRATWRRYDVTIA